MVWAFFTLGTYAVPTPHSERQMRHLVLFNFVLARQHTHISRSCGLRFSGSVLLKTLQHFDSTSFRLRLCSRVSSQPIHTTSSLKLDSVASELLRNVIMLLLSHTCPTDMMDLRSPVSLGAQPCRPGRAGLHRENITTFRELSLHLQTSTPMDSMRRQ